MAMMLVDLGILTLLTMQTQILNVKHSCVLDKVVKMEYFERRQLKLSDFGIICRFCMQVDLFLKPLFSEDDDGESDDFASEDGSSETVTEMVARCTQLEVDVRMLLFSSYSVTMYLQIRPDDNLPKFMCNFCLEELLRCNKFRRKCLLSDETLKYILETQNPEDESTETNSGGEDRISSLDDIYDVDKVGCLLFKLGFKFRVCRFADL